MENQPKLSNSKGVIAFLAERFPQYSSTEGEARPLKIGILQDLVRRVGGEMNLSKTQLRATLRLYTSSWCYLCNVRVGAIRIDLDGSPCGELGEQRIAHAHQQLEETKARAQTQHATQQARRREAATAADQQNKGVHRERKPRPQRPRREEGAERHKPRPVATKAPCEERRTPVSDVSVLTADQALKVKADNNAMDATALEITKDGVRVQLTSCMLAIVRAKHLVF